MKSTGVVRKIDELGRVVIPAEVRRTLGIENGDSLEIYTNGEQVVFKKYAPGCTFCGSPTIAKVLNGKLICSGCIEQLK